MRVTPETIFATTPVSRVRAKLAGSGRVSRMLRCARALAFALCAAAAVARAAPSLPEGAFGTTAVEGGNPRLEGRLVVDRAQPKPGEPFRVGLLLELDRGWHVYWRNPGQSGAAPQLHWQLGGATVGPIAWPFPEVFREADGFITTYGYRDEVLLASPAVLLGDAAAPLVARLDADVLVCKVQCIPGEFHLQRAFSADADKAPGRAERALFDAWSERVPQPLAARDSLQLESVYSQSAVRPGDSFRAALSVNACGASEGAPCASLEPATAAASDAFIPDPQAGLELSVTGGRRPPFLRGGFLLTMDGRASPDAPHGDSRLRGVLALRRDGRSQLVEVDLPLPRAAAGSAVTALDNPWLEPGELSGGAAGVSLWQALALALLGGLILNAMPCVLPVLAIKVFGLAELAQHRRGEVMAHGVAYGAGVLGSMVALAGLVAGLRAAGTAVGWGFQFQEPRFVAAISAVLVAFALSLFGVFEFRLDASRLAAASARSSGLRRSLFEGLLAVVLATPCSAPFLGTALGFAFASPAPLIFAIFLAIGVGLALPFMLVSAFPAWARFVPRSGAWMAVLSTGLGFALLGTLVWLVWIFGRALGSDAQALLLGYLVLLAAGLWLFGEMQKQQRLGAARVSAAAVLLLALLGLRALPVSAELRVRDAASSEASDSEGRRFSAGEVTRALAGGSPVFVYFTADWCLTCKVNERAVLSSSRVRSELDQLGFQTFKGDWTLRDEVIRSELARFGKAGVPLYLVYGPAAPDRPIVLPELLSVDIVVNALREAAQKEKRT
jgi:thiol:disulfide interchange protein DsbD